MRSTSRLLAALVLGGTVLSGCASYANKPEPAPHVVVAEDGGEEEVLPVDGDESDFDHHDRGGETKAGEILVTIGSIVSMLASAILPFLILL